MNKVVDIGDNITIMKEMIQKRIAIDGIMTSIPYNINTKIHGKNNWSGQKGPIGPAKVEETFATKGTLVMSLLQYSFPSTLFQAQNGTFRKP